MSARSVDPQRNLPGELARELGDGDRRGDVALGLDTLLSVTARWPRSDGDGEASLSLSHQ